MMNIDLTLRDLKKIIETINCVGNEVKKIDSNPTQEIQTRHQKKKKETKTMKVQANDWSADEKQSIVNFKLIVSLKKTAVTVIM